MTASKTTITLEECLCKLAEGAFRDTVGDEAIPGDTDVLTGKSPSDHQ